MEQNEIKQNRTKWNVTEQIRTEENRIESALHIVMITYLSSINRAMNWDIMFNLFPLVGHRQKCLKNHSVKKCQQRGWN